jgi:hypothetical protein
MRKVVSVKSATSVYIPDLVTLPKKGETITVKIKSIQSECAGLDDNPIQYYYVEDNAGTVYNLSLVDFSFLPTHNLMQFRVLNIYQLESSRSRPSYPYKQDTTNKWIGFIDELYTVQVIKPGDKPVTHKTKIKYTPCIKPKDYAVEVVNQKKLFDTHTSLLQKINLLLRDTSNFFLDTDKLETLITHLNDRDLDLLCSGGAFE